MQVKRALSKKKKVRCWKVGIVYYLEQDRGENENMYSYMPELHKGH